MQLIGLQFYPNPASTTCVPVPLKKVHVGVNVVDRIAAHTLEQTYSNTETCGIEAKYAFPLPENATVVEFSATFGNGRQITGVAKKREEARQEYQEAVQHGRHAALLEEDRPDIFEASIGNIQAGEEVLVKVQYCLELPVEEDAVRLTIPSHVGARYSPQHPQGSWGSKMQGASGTSDNLVYTNSGSGALFSATMMCQMGGGGIPNVSSPTHPSIQVQHDEHADTVTAQIEEASLSKDVVICIKPRDLFQPVVAWEEWSQHGTHALMLSFVPKFELPMIEKPEVVFVVDCSGSMSGRRIEQSKRALQIFMRSLPEGCRFNIVKFGTTFSSLAPQSMVYCDAQIEAASSYISAIGADMGGTEILRPLEFVHGMSLESGYSRQVIVLTDGQVRNEHQVIEFARSTQSRMFTLGIGSGVSTFLVNGLARVSNGHASFVQDHEKLEPVCISLLKKALTPAVSNIQISWPKILKAEPENVALTMDAGVLSAASTVLSFFNPAQSDSRAYRPRSCNTSGCSDYQQAPQKPPSVHSDSNFCAFALYPAGVNFQDAEVKITGDTPEGKLALSIPLPIHPVTRPRPLVHRMAARALIRDLEERSDHLSMDPDSSDEATRLSLHFSVLCQSTAFIAVDSQTGMTHPVDINKRVVPQPMTFQNVRMNYLASTLCSTSMCIDSGAIGEAVTCSATTTASARKANKCRSKGVQSAAKQSSFLGGYGFPRISSMFKRMSDPSEPKPTRAALGGASSIYFDKEKGRWRESECAETFSVDLQSPPKAKSAEFKMDESVDLGLQKSSCVPAAPSKMKALENLLCFAAANGSFKPAAQSILGLKDESITAWAVELSITTEILLTALVLGYLRRDFPGEKDTWSLVECKSVAWLQKQDHLWRNDIEALISKAGGKAWL
eukprot:gnl/MRDRNA2_/MRDRNA2_42344_c0_seq1.p1 gnl/MRDRNA2_/MRDRNA2_42344_c0~~gnl/MRDRNA2_/MRDRNA2_42344_c0_seq1.p1  ORF type:complete len:899 (+),score=162.08 gnl/MRDRNA2_/MRDRNA2_42344_c0_seq1:98-2794(+)